MLRTRSSRKEARRACWALSLFWAPSSRSVVEVGCGDEGEDGMGGCSNGLISWFMIWLEGGFQIVMLRRGQRSSRRVERRVCIALMGECSLLDDGRTCNHVSQSFPSFPTFPTVSTLLYHWRTQNSQSHRTAIKTNRPHETETETGKIMPGQSIGLFVLKLAKTDLQHTSSSTAILLLLLLPLLLPLTLTSPCSS